MNKEEQIGTLVGLDLILSPEHYKEINDLKEENKQLKEKIDKAIEHIKKYQYWNGDNYNCLHCEELLEILGDKE